MCSNLDWLHQHYGTLPTKGGEAPTEEAEMRHKEEYLYRQVAWASMNGHVTYLARLYYNEILPLLASKGISNIDLNALTIAAIKESPLFRACLAGEAEVVEFLIAKAGSSPSIIPGGYARGSLVDYHVAVENDCIGTTVPLIFFICSTT